MIIGLLGFSRAGKDSVAKPFISSGFKRIAFADLPKIDVAKNLGITITELEEKKDEYRDIIIEYAENKRKINPKVWIDRALNNVDLNQDIIITDIRRIPELEYLIDLKEKGFDVKIFTVERLKENGGKFDTDGETCKAFVFGMFNNLFDGRILNAGTIEDLYTQSYAVMMDCERDAELIKKQKEFLDSQEKKITKILTEKNGNN